MRLPASNQEAGKPQTVSIPGKALRDAPPAEGKSYPLVIVSHGYPGSRYSLSYLTENLASKGYVVAAIDHTDSVFGEEKGFQSTLLNRANDQLFTIGAIHELAASPGHFLKGIVDPARVGIVGYSSRQGDVSAGRQSASTESKKESWPRGGDYWTTALSNSN